MNRLYVAAHVPEAYLLRGLLLAAGIGARIVNEYAPGALGELPADAARPEVWIDDARDLPRAQKIVDAYEQAPTSQGLTRCPACGEDSPSGFALCWNCQRLLPA